jgi:hypothetical protein
MSMAAEVYYPDISANQRGINIVALPGPILVARVTSFFENRWRDGTWADTQWATFRDAARRAGKIPVGYHYIGMNPSPREQVARTLQHMGDHSIPVMLDWEKGGGDVNNLGAVVREYHKSGVFPKLSYVPRWYWMKVDRPSLVGLPPLVNSHYYDKNNSEAWKSYGGQAVRVLQYTDRERHSGMQIDMNLFRGTAAQLLDLLGLGPSNHPTLRRGDDNAHVGRMKELYNSHV